MTLDITIDDTVVVPGAPSIPGLRFRRYRDESDMPGMTDALNRSWAADGNEEYRTLEDLSNYFNNLKNSDLHQDFVIVEIDGKIVGYKQVEWSVELDGTYIYSHFGNLVPEWRGKGIGRALVRHSEARLREIAAGHKHDKSAYFETWTDSPQMDPLMASEGYESVRYGFSMVRPNLDNLPDAPLPEGLEVRPVRPEQWRAIWEAEVEAFKDHWGATEHDESDFTRWSRERPLFQPDLWQVAWDGDQVVGMVRNFIHFEENKQFDRKRGYTEYISVRRPWRKRGVARALIAHSFRMHKELGMEEAALGVDALNPNGALQLYESMGFEVVKRWTAYRKPIE